MELINCNDKIENNFEFYISLGLNCCNGLAFRQLELIKNSLPFDSVVSNPDIILDCFKNNFENFLNFEHNGNYLDKNLESFFKDIGHNVIQKRTNRYGIFFNHYIDKNEEEIKEIFKRRIDRLYEILKSDKKILFVYSTELCIYSKYFRDNQDSYYN